MTKVFYEAELLSTECALCGAFRDEEPQGEYEEVAPCSECGEDDLICDTSFEGLECVVCNHVFNPWEGAYIDEGASEDLYCAECVEEGGHR